MDISRDVVFGLDKGKDIQLLKTILGRLLFYGVK